MNSGLDPEVLVINGNSIVAAERFLGPPEKDANGVLNQISFDNAAIEMRPRHSTQVDELTSGLAVLFHSATAQMRLARLKHKIPRSARIQFIPAAELAEGDRELQSVSQFGCSPSRLLDDDYSSRNVVPICTAADTAIRSAGFHVHQELPHPGTAPAAVAVLDGLLGLWDVVMNHRAGWSEASRLRRMHLGYGRAGEHRLRNVSSGALVLEYRSLSPWPLSHPELTRRVVSTARSVAKRPIGDLMSVLEDFPDRDKITAAINEADFKSASLLRKRCVGVWAAHTL